MIKYAKQAKSNILCGDFNYNFINWDNVSFEGRDCSVQTDKVQASELLTFADQNDMTNLSVNPTKGSNVLDLFFTNDDDYQYDKMYVNEHLSDHNLIIFKYEKSIEYDNNGEKTNPYLNKIFEYEIDYDSDNWKNFDEYLCNFDIDTIDNLEAEDQIDIMYKIFDEAAEMFLNKKKDYDYENKVKKRFIPNNIRKLLRKKLKLSKRNLSSDNWKTNHKISEKLESVDYELSHEYKRQRMVEENRALEKN